MPRRYHIETYHHQTRYIRQARRFFGVLAVLLLLVGISLSIDAWWQDSESSTPSGASLGTTATYVPKVTVFRSPYFQFQADDSWSEVVPKAEAGIYRYRSFQGPLIEHELVIMVNSDAPAVPVTHVLPTRVASSGSFLPTSVSDHCRTVVPNPTTVATAEVTLKGVTFTCAVENTRYLAAVGLIDEGLRLTLSRPSGEKADYQIYYHNLTAQPGGEQLQRIIESFQTR